MGKVQRYSKVLKVADIREANINVVCNWRMTMLGDLNARAISLEAVNEIKSGKAPGPNGFPVECLKKYGVAVLEWLVRLLYLSVDMGVYLWTRMVLVLCPCTQGRLTCECSTSRCVCLV